MDMYSFFKSARNVEYLYEFIVDKAGERGYTIDSRFIPIVHKAMEMTYKTTKRRTRDANAFLEQLNTETLKKCFKYITENSEHFTPLETGPSAPSGPGGDTGVPNWIKPRSTVDASNEDIDQRYSERLAEYNLQPMSRRSGNERANLTMLIHSTPSSKISSKRYIRDIDALRNYLVLDTSKLLELQTTNTTLFDVVAASMRHAVKKGVQLFEEDDSASESSGDSDVDVSKALAERTMHRRKKPKRKPKRKSKSKSKPIPVDGDSISSGDEQSSKPGSESESESGSEPELGSEISSLMKKYNPETKHNKPKSKSKQSPVSAPVRVPSIFSVDFRRDLIDVKDKKYIVKLPKPMTISNLRINACILPNIPSIESEPYLYIKIDELRGNTVDGTNVLGKIYQSNESATAGQFVRYKTDAVYLGEPVYTDKLTISILTFEMNPIDLTLIEDLRRIKASKGKSPSYTFVTSVPHYMLAGEKIGIAMRYPRFETLLQHTVHRASSRSITIKSALPDLSDDIRLRRTTLKCTMTFENVVQH